MNRSPSSRRLYPWEKEPYWTGFCVSNIQFTNWNLFASVNAYWTNYLIMWKWSVERIFSFQSRDSLLLATFGPHERVFCLSGVLPALRVSCGAQGRVRQGSSFFYGIHREAEAILKTEHKLRWHFPDSKHLNIPFRAAASPTHQLHWLFFYYCQIILDLQKSYDNSTESSCAPLTRCPLMLIGYTTMYICWCLETNISTTLLNKLQKFPGGPAG